MQTQASRRDYLQGGIFNMTVGTGKYTYEVVQGWGQLPQGWRFGWIPAVAVDSQDRVWEIFKTCEKPDCTKENC